MKLIRMLRYLANFTGLDRSYYVAEALCDGACDKCYIKFKCYTEQLNGVLLLDDNEYNKMIHLFIEHE